MKRRTSTLRHWLDIVTTTVLMGLSSLVGMLALEYLVTGTFGAAKEYFLIALLITACLATLQWRRFRSRPGHLNNRIGRTPHARP